MSDDLVVRAVSGEVVEQPETPAAVTLRPLTDMQEAFVSYYIGVSHFDATDAARRAGFAHPKESGYQCKQMAHVRARIDAFLDAEALTASEVLAETRAVALAPTSHFMQMQKESYMDQDGITHPAQIRLDYSSKMKALELLGKDRGRFREKIDLDVAFVPKRLIGVSEDDL